MEKRKEKLLIIGMCLRVGGAEKSLVNLLNMIDYDRYEVDFLLFQKNGVFLKQVPPAVHRVGCREIDILFHPLSRSLKRKNLSPDLLFLAAARYGVTLLEKIRWRQFDQIRIHRWIDFFGKWIPEMKKEYDCGIAFAGGETTYFLAEKVKCRRKVCFFHSDYGKIGIDASLEERYLEQMQQIMTISDVCKRSLEKLFPGQKEKITVLQNLSPVRMIRELGEAFYPKEYQKDFQGITLVSVGRLDPVKGYDMAVSAAAILHKKKIPFRWYVIGEGEERKRLSGQIRSLGLEEQFFLLGQRENPYPYIAHGDILVQTSRREGKSIVLDEAKALKKPIVVTAYPSAEDQVRQGETGLIVPVNPEGIAEGILRLYGSRELRQQISAALEKEDEKMLEDVGSYMDVLCGHPIP